MSYTYAQRRHPGGAETHTEASPKGPSLESLRAGAVKPTAEQMGRRVDLPDVMREKMESAFGADLSAVKLYESQTVADAGAKAVTQGSSIAFAPGMLDFSSYGGQTLLGHELSHVVSQARGEVTGGGFLNDRALEARADREGAMAAGGQQIAMPTAALSPVTAAAADGPMQAARNKKDKDALPPKPQTPAPRPPASAPAPAPAQTTAPAGPPALPPLATIDPKKAGQVNQDASIYNWVVGSTYDQSIGSNALQRSAGRPEAAGLTDALRTRYSGPNYRQGLGDISNGKDVTIRGLGLNRMLDQVSSTLGEGYSNEEITQMYDDLMAPHRADVNPDDEASFGPANEQFLKGLRTLKGMQLNQLRRMQASFGKLGTQMHPDDFIRQVGSGFNDYFHLTQDTADMVLDAPKSVYDPENNPEDAEYRDLQYYYGKVSDRHFAYAQLKGAETTSNPMDPSMIEDTMMNNPENNPEMDPELMNRIHGPSMSQKEERAYQKGLRKRAGRKGSNITLFGKFDPNRKKRKKQ